VVALASRISIEHGEGGPGRAGGEGGFLDRLASGGHLGDAGLDHQLAFGGGEAEALTMGGGEGGDDLVMRAEGNGQEAVGTGIAQVQPAGGGDAAGLGTLAEQLGAALGGQAIQTCGEVVHGCRRERRLDGGLADHGLVGEAHAVGGEHPREGMDEDRLHTELVGHQTGMLAAGAAEALQGVAGDVVALLDRDLLDRIGHVGDGDAEEALGHRARVLRRAGGDGNLGS
jgi:hypothetical protein